MSVSQASPVSRKKTPVKLVFFQIAVPLVALLLSLGGTVSTWRVSLSHSRLQLLERFRAQTSEASFLLQKRIDLYGNALYSTRALFAATSGPVTPDAWTAFTGTENLHARFPGMTAIRFIERVPAEDKAMFVQNIRTQPGGIPYFEIKPSGDRPEYFVIKYVYPLTGNESMLGYDVGAEPELRAMYEKSRDTRSPVATPPFESADPQDRTILLVQHVEREGKSFIGFADVVLQLNALLKSSFGAAGVLRDIRFEIYDGRESEGTLLYDSHAGKRAAPLKEPLAETIPMEVGQRVWLLKFTALAEFEDPADRKLSELIFFSGIAMSVLLAGILYAFATSSTRAARLADRMTEDLSREVAERTSAEEKLQVLVKDLERRNREASSLSHLAQLLQSCSHVEEAYQAFGKFAGDLFPGTRGAMYCFNSTRHFLEAVVEWGTGLPGDRVFGPEDCWALKQAKPYVSLPGESELLCKHVGHTPAHGSLCVPLVAQGEVLGILHVRDLRGELADREALKNIAVAAAEEVALTLANLRLREALHSQSIRDRVTGLFNRHYLDESLERELLRATRQGERLAVILLDLDHFKKINDSHGHEVGDLVLAAVGKFLSNRLRGSDIPCRYGGEEFLLILPSTTLEKAFDIAEDLRKGAKDIRVSNPDVRVTLSGGVSVFPDHAADAELLLRAADTALYEAKRDGRDRIKRASSI